MSNADWFNLAILGCLVLYDLPITTNMSQIC